MAIQNKAELEALYASLFPDNAAGEISAADVREFMQAILDSLNLLANDPVEDNAAAVLLVATDVDANAPREAVFAGAMVYTLPLVATVQQGVTLIISRASSTSLSLATQGIDIIVGNLQESSPGIWRVIADPSNNRWVSEFTPFDSLTINPTVNFIPLNDSGNLGDSPLRYDSGQDIVISSKSIQTPAASVKIGSNATLSDSGSGIGYSLGATGSTFELSGSQYSAASGTLSGLTITEYPSAAIDINTQVDDSESLTIDYYQWKAEITGIPEDLFRVYAVTLRGAAGAQAPVRLRIFIEDPMLNPSAVPIYNNVDESEWENGNAGFMLVDGMDTFVDFEQGQRLRSNSPFWIVHDVPAGEQFSIKGATVDIGFGAVFVPYQVSNVMAGNELQALPTDDSSTGSNRNLSAQEVDSRISNSGAGYVLATWGGDLQNTGRYPTINGASNTTQVSGLGVNVSAPVPAAGTIDTLTYYNTSGDATTELQIIKNGVVMYTFTCTAFYGKETGINVPIGFVGGVPDNIAIRYSAGTKPAAGFYSMYIN